MKETKKNELVTKQLLDLLNLIPLNLKTLIYKDIMAKGMISEETNKTISDFVMSLAKSECPYHPCDFRNVEHTHLEGKKIQVTINEKDVVSDLKGLIKFK